MDGWMDGWVGGWVSGWMNGWVGEWMGKWMDWWGDWVSGWMNEWVGGWMSERMDGWMVIWIWKEHLWFLVTSHLLWSHQEPQFWTLLILLVKERWGEGDTEQLIWTAHYCFLSECRGTINDWSELNWTELLVRKKINNWGGQSFVSFGWNIFYSCVKYTENEWVQV